MTDAQENHDFVKTHCFLQFVQEEAQVAKMEAKYRYSHQRCKVKGKGLSIGTKGSELCDIENHNWCALYLCGLSVESEDPQDNHEADKNSG
jgi:hypothetical protein